MTRRATFSSANAKAALPDDEMLRKFQTDGRIDVSGHNYLIDVTVTGEVDAKSGILVNIKEIDRLVQQHIVKPLQGRVINWSVEAFHCLPVTPETLARYAAAQLAPSIPIGATLTRVRVEASPGYWAEWHASPLPIPGPESESMLLTRTYEFSASHRLDSPSLSPEENRELFGKCNYINGHGHNYELEVTVTGPTDGSSGCIMDPTVLDCIVNREVIDRYDHRHLNLDIPEFGDVIPSGEGISKVIWTRVSPHLTKPVRLYRILLRETPRNFFEYYGEDSKV